MPTAFDDRERAAIRERLLAAAVDALGRGGLGAASVAELAAAASIAKGSFYLFYDSKEELFMDALEGIERDYRAIFEAAPALPGTAFERVHAAFQAAFAKVTSDPAVTSMDGRTLERLTRALPPERVARHVEADAAAMATIAAAWSAAGLLGPGVGAAELAGAGYAVFLMATGLRNLPEGPRAATVAVVALGLALALAGTEGAIGEGSDERGGRRDSDTLRRDSDTLRRYSDTRRHEERRTR
ncbi:MAG TPA: TetR family transcriptional regulator [Spirochaetales bacterium]|nr:TetR family transcriptional regulator [Spirochaetales bacterium]